MEKVCFSKCPVDLDSLEDTRDEAGFIDLDDANIVVVEGSRNQIGATDIFKYWFDFNGQKVLLKQEKSLDGEQNGSLYSELIMHALCEFMRVRSAKVDCFKLGNIKGIISHMVFNPEKESMIMTRELIGDIPCVGDSFDFKTVEDKIKEALISQFEISPKEAENVILKRRLQKIIQLYSSEMDNHLENEALLFSRDQNGKYHVRTCPLFDNELSFGLHATISELMQDNLFDSLQTKNLSSIQKEAILSLKSKKLLTKEQFSALREIGSKDELVRILLSDIQIRNRVAGNGKQVVIDEKSTPRFDSKSDATLAMLYHESKIALQNPDLDDDLIERHETIINFIEELKDLDIKEILDLVEETVPLPPIIKTQVKRFAHMKSNVLGFVVEGVGELDYYERMADIVLKRRDKDKDSEFDR